MATPLWVELEALRTRLESWFTLEYWTEGEGYVAIQGASLDAGEDLHKAQELLEHRLVTTTLIYDKRRRGVKESALHDVPY